MKDRNISLELARVHAHLCGDGYVCKYKTKEKDRVYRAIIGYCNNNKILIDNFEKILINYLMLK